MPSSSGVSSRTALPFLRLPDLGCHVCHQIRINASYWLRTIRACACGCYFRPTICTYSTSSYATASTTLMLPRSQATVSTTRFAQATSALVSSPPSTPLSRSHRSKGLSEDQEKKKNAKKKQGKGKTSGYETASLGFVADSFRFPNRAVPQRVSLQYTRP